MTLISFSMAQPRTVWRSGISVRTTMVFSVTGFHTLKPTNATPRDSLTRDYASCRLREPRANLHLSSLREALRGRRDVHASQPRVISLTNTTELGTLYRPDEIAGLADFAKSNGLVVHVDGARFANAVASAGCTPAELTWKAGVDVLVFGGTKNGLAFGEAVVFFGKTGTADFLYRMKQSGQLASKMRFLAAQWIGLLSDGRWLDYAGHSNAMAKRLYSQLSRLPEIRLLFPCEGNAVFAKIPDLDCNQAL